MHRTLAWPIDSLEDDFQSLPLDFVNACMVVRYFQASMFGCMFGFLPP